MFKHVQNEDRQFLEEFGGCVAVLISAKKIHLNKFKFLKKTLEIRFEFTHLL